MELKKHRIPLWVIDAICNVIFFCVFAVAALLIKHDTAGKFTRYGWYEYIVYMACVVILYSSYYGVLVVEKSRSIFEGMGFRAVITLISLPVYKFLSVMYIFNAAFLMLCFIWQYKRHRNDNDARLWRFFKVSALVFIAIMVLSLILPISNVMWDGAITAAVFSVAGVVYGVLAYWYLRRMDAHIFSVMMLSPFTPMFSGGALIGMLAEKMILGLINKGSQGIETKQ